jgi:hypothetical protein
VIYFLEVVQLLLRKLLKQKRRKVRFGGCPIYKLYYFILIEGAGDEIA